MCTLHSARTRPKMLSTLCATGCHAFALFAVAAAAGGGGFAAAAVCIVRVTCRAQNFVGFVFGFGWWIWHGCVFCMRYVVGSFELELDAAVASREQAHAHANKSVMISINTSCETKNEYVIGNKRPS